LLVIKPYTAISSQQAAKAAKVHKDSPSQQSLMSSSASDWDPGCDSQGWQSMRLTWLGEGYRLQNATSTSHQIQSSTIFTPTVWLFSSRPRNSKSSGNPLLPYPSSLGASKRLGSQVLVIPRHNWGRSDDSTSVCFEGLHQFNPPRSHGKWWKNGGKMWKHMENDNPWE